MLAQLVRERLPIEFDAEDLWLYEHRFGRVYSRFLFRQLLESGKRRRVRHTGSTLMREGEDFTTLYVISHITPGVRVVVKKGGKEIATMKRGQFGGKIEYARWVRKEDPTLATASTQEQGYSKSRSGTDGRGGEARTSGVGEGTEEVALQPLDGADDHEAVVEVEEDTNGGDGGGGGVGGEAGERGHIFAVLNAVLADSNKECDHGREGGAAGAASGRERARRRWRDALKFWKRRRSEQPEREAQAAPVQSSGFHIENQVTIEVDCSRAVGDDHGFTVRTMVAPP